MKVYSWILGVVALGFSLSGARALADENSANDVEPSVCSELSEDTISGPLPFVWKNGRDTPVRLIYFYMDHEGFWRTRDTVIAGKGKVTIEVLGRCVYWYAKRGKAIYTPKNENAKSSLDLYLDGKPVKSNAIDLAGREGSEFTFTLN